MKYAVLFGIIATCLPIFAAVHRGWLLILIWPALSISIVAVGYFRSSPQVFGKSQQGRLAPLNQILLLPFLAYSWLVWHAIRLLTREPAFTQLLDNVVIGRRLLSHELPDNIDHVINLTCEFNEPIALRERNYHSFQILDGSAPRPEQLVEWAQTASNLPARVYIHCAQGHGRTGTFAAAMLLCGDRAATVDKAIRLIQSKRPLVRLNRDQMAALLAMEGCLQKSKRH